MVRAGLQDTLSSGVAALETVAFGETAVAGSMLIAAEIARDNGIRHAVSLAATKCGHSAVPEALRVAAETIGTLEVETTVAAIVLATPARFVAREMIARNAAIGIAASSLSIASESSDHHRASCRATDRTCTGTCGRTSHRTRASAAARTRSTASASPRPRATTRIDLHHSRHALLSMNGAVIRIIPSRIERVLKRLAGQPDSGVKLAGSV